jgi:hypothetical protein
MSLINPTMDSVNKTKKRYWHLLVTDENREKLRACGKAGDSFNDVISKLLSQNNLLQTSPQK